MAFPSWEDCENLISFTLCDEDDPSRLSLQELKDSWGAHYPGPCCNFMRSYGLNPWKDQDVQEALAISRGIKECNQEDTDSDGDKVTDSTVQDVAEKINSFKLTPNEEEYVEAEDSHADVTRVLGNCYNMTAIVIHSAEDLVKQINDNREISQGIKVTINFQITQPFLQLFSDSNLGIHTEELSFIAIPRDNFEGYDECEKNMEVLDFVLDFSEVSFPRLKALEIYIQAIKDIHFTKENMPMLNSLNIESPGIYRKVGKFNLDLPELESIYFLFVELDDGTGFGKSLSRCPKLRYFSSYKLRGLDVTAEEAHLLALPNCEYLDMYRSDSMNYLKIWAPKLEYLSLQACFALQRVIILDQKPSGYCGPNYSFSGIPAKFYVNLINADIPKGNLASYKRCKKDFQ